MVEFIDYGSKQSISSEVKALTESYSFVNYTYSYCEYQPWNKSRALNIIIKRLATTHCFVSDVDIIFSPYFVETLHQLKSEDKAIYFQVGYLSEKESKKEVAFEDYEPKFLSNKEATGLTLFPTSKLKELNGFDEFFHFWGAEDTDMHHRLRSHGVNIEYYDEALLILHQWHKSFLSETKKDFRKEFVLTDIVLLNHEHKDKNHRMRVTKVNLDGWGELIEEIDFLDLMNSENVISLSNDTKEVNHLLHSLLPSNTNNILSIEIKRSNNFSPKKSIKKIMGKKVPHYYSMKKVNDLLLMQLIAHYRNKNYIYEVSENGEKITLKIKL